MLTQTNSLQKEKARQLREKQQQTGKMQAQLLEPLHLTACMLYWAEGSKSKNMFQFTNCDPEMHKILLMFIRKYFPQFLSRLRFRVNFYPTPTLPYEKVRDFWCQELGVSPDAFTKPTDKSKYYTQPKINKYPNGVLYMQASVTEVIQHVLGAIDAYQKLVAVERIELS